jgi:beta-glucosidase
MVSYSSWNGEKMHGHDYLISTVLKGEMGFDGFVVSDWQGIDQVAENYYDAVVQSTNAGVDMNMVPYNANLFLYSLQSAVQNGDISEGRINDAVRRILTVKFEMGLFEDPYLEDLNMSVVGSDDHRAVAQEAVSQSLVLLQNENDALPIDKDAVVFVAGLDANDVGVQCGGWTIEWQGHSGYVTTGTTILAGLEEIGGEKVFYNRFGKFEQFNQQGDVGIVVIGESPYAEGVGDSDDLGLTETDIGLIERVRPQVDQLVVVLISGRPLIITKQLDLADAWVAAWLPGTEGQGVARNLYGEHPFTGKLPVSWPRSMDQLPFNQTGAEPLFPFGYGLQTD